MTLWRPDTKLEPELTPREIDDVTQLRRFLLSVTAKDVSILITFRSEFLVVYVLHVTYQIKARPINLVCWIQGRLCFTHFIASLSSRENTFTQATNCPFFFPISRDCPANSISLSLNREYLGDPSSSPRPVFSAFGRRFRVCVSVVDLDPKPVHRIPAWVKRKGEWLEAYASAVDSSR